MTEYKVATIDELPNEWCALSCRLSPLFSTLSSLFCDTIHANLHYLMCSDSSKQVEIEGAKVLVGRTNGELFAVSGTCPHYGAPLVNGVRTKNYLLL